MSASRPRRPRLDAAGRAQQSVPLFRGRRPAAACAFGLIHGCGFNLVRGNSANWPIATLLPLAWLRRLRRRQAWWYCQLLSTGSLLIALLAPVCPAERVFDLKLISE